MSYARFNEDGSDVYVYSDGEHFFCYSTGWASNEYSNQVDLLHHLVFHHIKDGECVPDKTIERLVAEIMDQPYETDVQKGLREAQQVSPE